MTPIMRAVTRWPATMARLVADSARWVRGRRDLRPRTTPIAYGKSATTLLWAVTVMTVVETAIVELVIGWAWLRITLAVVCIGSLLLMAGSVAAYRLHPHLLGPSSLVLRSGKNWEVEVPLSLIASIGTTVGTAPQRPGVVAGALELGVGTTDVVLTLRAPQDLPDGDEAGAPVDIDRIRCSADDPGTFVRLVRKAMDAAPTPAGQSLRR